MQEKRNKKLLAILLALIAVVVVLYFVKDESDKIDINREVFAYDNPSQIDQVSIDLGEEVVNLSFDGARWLVNDRYKADPQRIKVLFAVLKQIRARRAAARQQQDSLKSAMSTKGQAVSFLSKGEELHRFDIMGNPEKGLTFISQPQEDIFLAEIPGYRSYLAGIFEVDEQGWRDPLVFDINWRNIKAVRMIYPDQLENSFDVSFNEGEYEINQLPKTDTTKLFDLLDEVSRLYVNDYLQEAEVNKYTLQKDTTIATIALIDVGDNYKTLEILGEIDELNTYLVKKDSSDFAVIPSEMLRTILRPRRFFKAPKN